MIQGIRVPASRWIFKDPLDDLVSYCDKHKTHYIIEKRDNEYIVVLRLGTESEVRGFPSSFLADAIYQALWTDWEYNVGQKSKGIAIIEEVS